MRRFLSPVLLVLCFVSFFACRQAVDSVPYSSIQSAVEDSCMVVAAHPLAVAAGIEILQAGGNAIDAAIAVQFALAVVCPRAGNIGGGGFMVLRLQDGTVDALDYREKAPLAGERDMYLDAQGAVIDSLSSFGHLAVGVPGTVKGLEAAHSKYGKVLEFGRLLVPAIRLAQEGFRITGLEAERLNLYQSDFKQFNTVENVFTTPKQWQAGDLLVQTDLAKTLTEVKLTGSAGFYQGRVARLIISEMERGGGILNQADLDQYQAKWRSPLVDAYKNYRIIAMPPPSSGGVALLQLLNMVEPYPLAEYGFHKPESVHLMAESMRRVYADRAYFLGDMDFVEVPIDSMLDEEYLAFRMQDFDPALVTASDSIYAGDFQVLIESFETTHTSVVDPGGNAVAVTTTLNSNYGSKVLVGGAGFFLNNEMDDFSMKPGVPNQFGLIGAAANAIEPQKRMLSSMTPTIIEKDGQLFMLLGSPGGSTIITSVMQVFLNVAEFGLPFDQAVHAPRFHHQWLPNELWYEQLSLPQTTLDSLVKMGHLIVQKENIGRVKAILVMEDGRLWGVGDIRNSDDHAAGF